MIYLFLLAAMILLGAFALWIPGRIIAWTSSALVLLILAIDTDEE
jgi:hypothetical protein